MRFRTILDLEPSNVKIGHNDLIFMIGSCFTSYIGQKFIENRFSAMVNPYGTLYHPDPIKYNLKVALLKEDPNLSLITQQENRHVYLKMHSKVSSDNPQNLISLIQHLNQKVKDYLSKAHIVIITLGSAFYFFHNELRETVGNCHKLPGQLFSRQLSSIKEITGDIQETIENILYANPACQIVFTISPVRHVRDGLIANSRSKAHLLSAVHRMVDKYERVQYFPAYEILMDDLRGYRYYSDDLIHPNSQATEYIWNKFSDQYFTKQTKDINKKITKINSTLNHRPFDSSSDSYIRLIQKVEKDMLQLESTFQINFDEVKNRIKKLLD